MRKTSHCFFQSALWLSCLALLLTTSLEAGARSEWPAGFDRAFVLPATEQDQYGNPVTSRQGKKFDPETGWPYEIWLKDPRIEFVLVPAGEFLMGNSLTPEQTAAKYGGKAQAFLDEIPQHKVWITRTFYIGKYEVTNHLFRRFRPSHSSKEHRGNSLDEESHPAVFVSWQDAVAFCDWLGQQTGVEMRLTTEAEWEHACRAGTRTPFYWGMEADSRYCNFADKNVSLRRRHVNSDDGYAVTAPVGRFTPNASGIYDMLGNVYEWCMDGKREYSPEGISDPVGPEEGPRLLRGGSWGSLSRYFRCANRLQRVVTHKGNIYGFRVCATPSLNK